MPPDKPRSRRDGVTAVRTEGRVPALSAGKGTYVDDIQLPRDALSRIVRSPYAHAKIKKIDTSKALAIPGAPCRHHPAKT